MSYELVSQSVSRMVGWSQSVSYKKILFLVQRNKFQVEGIKVDLKTFGLDCA